MNVILEHKSAFSLRPTHANPFTIGYDENAHRIETLIRNFAKE